MFPYILHHYFIENIFRYTITIIIMTPFHQIASAGLLLGSSTAICNAFLAPVEPVARHTSNLYVTNGMPDSPKTTSEDQELQWDLFTRHQALDGEWWGSWDTYDYMGDRVSSTVAGVSLKPDKDSTSVEHKHRILSSSTQSDCNTCFSSSEVTTMPTIATYTPETLGRRHRCAAVGMVVGPSLLKSGAMSTELSLRHGNGRVRVTFQHAPVWERGVEPGSCPPQGLKLFRAVVSKERLRDSSDELTEGTIQGPPSADEEKQYPPQPGNPRFFRPVPPFDWHAKWAGTSWTWGPQTGDRGWAVEDLEEADSWHGRPTGDTAGVWSLRLPGGALIQCPRVIVGGMPGICRLAWMPESEGKAGTPEDGNKAKLLRLEASVSALEPIISDDDDDMMIGFYPPSLGSLRTDMMEKVGELEGATLEERERAAEGYVFSQAAQKTDTTETPSPSTSSQRTSAPIDDKLEQKIAEDPRNALDL